VPQEGTEEAALSETIKQRKVIYEAKAMLSKGIMEIKLGSKTQ
jgi:hypothetical protein